MSEILNEISTYLQAGKAQSQRACAGRPLTKGYLPPGHSGGACWPALNVIGGKFKNNEVFVPEVLVRGTAP